MSFEKPMMVGYTQDHISKLFEFKVGIEDHIYTYELSSAFIADGIIRKQDHFSFKEVNKLKEHGRLICKEPVKEVSNDSDPN